MNEKLFESEIVQLDIRVCKCTYSVSHTNKRSSIIISLSNEQIHTEFQTQSIAIYTVNPRTLLFIGTVYD